MPGQERALYPVVFHDGRTHWFTPASELEKAHRPEFVSWAQAFRTSPAGRNAIRELGSLRLYNNTKFNRFEEQVLLECFWAFRYEEGGREHFWKTLWAEDQRQREMNPRLAEAFGDTLESLVHCLEKNPLHAEFHVRNAFEKTLGLSPDGNHAIKLMDLLIALKEQFRTVEPSIRWCIACLAYNKDVANRNLPADETRTGLEFALALRFRHFTGAAGSHPLNIQGCTMPKDGEPHYKLVALFRRATFDGVPYQNPATLKDEAGEIRERLGRYLRRYRDLTYVGWPVRI